MEASIVSKQNRSYRQPIRNLAIGAEVLTARGQRLTKLAIQARCLHGVFWEAVLTCFLMSAFRVRAFQDFAVLLLDHSMSSEWVSKSRLNYQSCLTPLPNHVNLFVSVD
jgi:hypothetical protein